MELELESERQQGAHEVGGAPRRDGGPPGLHPWQVFFLFSEKLLHEVSGHSENFCFLHMKQHHGNSAENSVSPG